MHALDSSKERGTSLVEVMIGLVIGMIVILVIYQIVTTFEGQKRTTTEGAGAQENGLFAITALERDIRMAGWGLVGATVPDCHAGVYAMDNGVSNASFALTPVRIIDGGTAPDTITVKSGTSIASSSPTQVTRVLSNASAELEIYSVMGIQDNNAVLVVNTDGTCTLSQVTQVQAGPRLIQRNPGGANPMNPNGGIRSAWPAESIDAQLYNFGSFTSRTYQVNPGVNALVGTLEMQDLGIAASGVADNIVSIKAQYGVAPSGSQVVNQWVNATGAWANPVAADVARIKAVRLFIVARSPVLEKRDASGACVATPSAPKPRWQNGDPVVISLTATPNWKCYRYRSFETVVPLRNVLWNT